MKKKHVLIAEDDTFLVQMMQEVLMEHGMRVTVAGNGKAAIDVLADETPDLILLDLLMPHVDGFAVLQHMADNKVRCPVIVISNLSDKATKDRCKKFGVSDFVIKSDVDDEQLWPMIEKHL